nr:hypothetical protein [Aureispira sp. CCB-QB1]
MRKKLFEKVEGIITPLVGTNLGARSMLIEVDLRFLMEKSLTQNGIFKIMGLDSMITV